MEGVVSLKLPQIVYIKQGGNKAVEFEKIISSTASYTTTLQYISNLEYVTVVKLSTIQSIRAG